MLSITLHKTSLIHTFVKMNFVQLKYGSTQATRGCDRVSRVFSGLMSIFVFVILYIPSGCIQNCNECTAAICTYLATKLHVAQGTFETLKSS